MSDFGRFKVHPFAAEFPIIPSQEFERLVDDIRQNGLVDPIVLASDNETIVDGRNRYLACNEALVDPRFTLLPSSFTEEQIIGYIVSANVRRRHLTEGQLALAALEAEKLLAVEAKKRHGQRHDLAPNIPQNSGESRKAREAGSQAGKLVGVSHDSVQRAKKIATEPDIAGEVRAGKKSLNEGYKEVRKRETARQQNIPDREAKPLDAKKTISLVTHKGDIVEYPLPLSKPTFNPANQHISWAAWTWNPVTGCLHGCKYCYAREIATKNDESSRRVFPVGFTPLFHRERLDAPKNHAVPADVDANPRNGRVFVCSMADLYGEWVPDTWIEQVHDVCASNPQWEYLLLTKFPSRYNRLRPLPKTAWVGTSVDEQKRVRIAENAFRGINNVAVKWLSLEPLREELRFNDLSMFDWVVIGSQTATRQPDERVPEFAPPFEWVARIVFQAREAGCKIWLKPNLIGNVNDQSPGMQLPQEVPETKRFGTLQMFGA